jgi:DNA-binding response OmpR family regulator
LQGHAGFDCSAVSSGGEVQSLCAARSPDVILLDLHLGDINGFDVVRLLHADPRTASIPIILCTGESRMLDVLHSASRSANAFAFLHKPFDLTFAADLIRQAAAARSVTPDPWTISRPPVYIDLRLRRVRVHDADFQLGPKRFDCLCALGRSKDGLTLPLLRAMVWGSDLEPLNTVAKTVSRLRDDMRAACGIELIVNIPGGYKLQ